MFICFIIEQSEGRPATKDNTVRTKRKVSILPYCRTFFINKKLNIIFIPRGSQLKKSSYASQKITKKISKNDKKIKKSQKITKNLFKFNMGEIVKIKKSSKKSESSKFWGKNQKIFVHPRTELRTPRFILNKSAFNLNFNVKL